MSSDPFWQKICLILACHKQPPLFFWVWWTSLNVFLWVIKGPSGTHSTFRSQSEKNKDAAETLLWHVTAFPPRAERVGCGVGQLGNISSLAAGKSTCSLLVNIFIWVWSSDHSRKSGIHACAFQTNACIQLALGNWTGKWYYVLWQIAKKGGKEAGGQKLKWRMHHYVWVFFILA